MNEIMSKYPADVGVVVAITRYNKKLAAGKASISVSSGVVTAIISKYNDDTDTFTQSEDMVVSKDELRAIRDRFTAYAALIQAFLDSIKNL